MQSVRKAILTTFSSDLRFALSVDQRVLGRAKRWSVFRLIRNDLLSKFLPKLLAPKLLAAGRMSVHGRGGGEGGLPRRTFSGHNLPPYPMFSTRVEIDT
jgi:hypothetical protein